MQILKIGSWRGINDILQKDLHDNDNLTEQSDLGNFQV